VLAHDPQTSGGLLAAIPPGAVESVEAALAVAGVDSWRVGEVQASDSPSIALM
jgi:selenophosphate synthase